MALYLGQVSRALRSAFGGLKPKNINPRYGITSTFSTTNTDATGQQPPTESQKNETKEQIDVKNYEELMEEKTKLNEKVFVLEDKYKRALAETESVRQRYRKEVEDAKIFGIRSFCKDLLPVADVLTKVNSLFKTGEQKKDDFDTIQEGIKGIEAQLQQVFSRHGLQKIDPVEGEKFNPKFHQSLFILPLPKPEELSGKPMPESGSIMNVSKCGYKLHEETIRPAGVGIYE